MRVAALQFDTIWQDRQANFSCIKPWIESAAVAGARLLVLPEMFACGFTMNTDLVAEPAGGPTTQFLQTEAEAHGLWIAGSLPEGAEGQEGSPEAKPFNTLVIAGPSGELHRYRKIHPFTYAGEHEHYQAGQDRITVRIDDLSFSLFICYDLRFADEFWAVAPKTDAYLVVANWPETRRQHWMTLLEARAIENQAYVVGVNRVGQGGNLTYTGDSRIIDPMGRLLATASNAETLLLADLDPQVVRSTREQLPFLPDRRSETPTSV